MTAPQSDEERSRQGLLYGLAAYGLWGVLPHYFRLIGRINPLEVLAHRVLWSAILLALLVTVWRRWPGVVRAVRTRDVMLMLLGSTLLIAVNWLVFIYSMNHDRLLEASFAYFATPLANVLLGVLFLGERLRRLQLASIGLAAAGVMILGQALGGWPWIPVVLAGSFAFYGLLRKVVAADGFLALMIETSILAPLGLAYLLILQAHGEGEFAKPWSSVHWLLLASGLVTAVPLLLFVAAARRLTMSTLGFLQYIAPTMQFALAVWAYGEPVKPTHIAAFGLIWLAIGVYSVDSLRVYQRLRHAQAVADPVELVEEPG